MYGMYVGVYVHVDVCVCQYSKSIAKVTVYKTIVGDITTCMCVNKV